MRSISGKSSGTDAARAGRHLCRKPDWFVSSSWISVSRQWARNEETSVVGWLLCMMPSRSVVPYPTRARLIAVEIPQPLRPFCQKNEKMKLFI